MSQRNDIVIDQDCAVFCQQLSTILKAGIPLHEGMDSLRETYADTRYGRQFVRIAEELEARGTLADALEKAAIFPPYLNAMVRIGEASGKLETVLEGLADYYSERSEIAASLKRAVTYPCILIAMMTVVVVILVHEVLPIFNKVYLSLGTDPASQGYIEAGTVFGTIVLAVLAAILAGVLSLALLYKAGKGAAAAGFIGRLYPPYRKIERNIAASRFASVMSLMMGAGYPVERAAALSQEAIDDPKTRERIAAVAAAMAGGKTFGEAVGAAGIYEPLHVKMIQVAGAAGATDQVLASLAGIYQSKVTDSLEAAVAGLEPTLVAVLSLIVAGLLVSVMLPLIGILAAMA